MFINLFIGASIPLVIYEVIKELALESIIVARYKTRIDTMLHAITDPITKYLITPSYNVCSMAYYGMLWWISRNSRNNVVKREPGLYEISYSISGKSYKLLVKPRRGPTPMITITDENEKDVTEDILQYLGPEYNWHNQVYTPGQLGYKSLSFEYPNGTSASFPEFTSLAIKF